MDKLTIKGSISNSEILVGEDFRHFEKYLPKSKVIVITDTNVNKIYGQYFVNYPVIEIGTGELNKTFNTVNNVLARLIELQADRSSFILAVGGGIVCDLAGFVASIYLRGIKFGFISTTLLAQVDASVGGKNGVNILGYKNMAGVFNQPQFVICDPLMLSTLTRDDLNCGFAEIVKHTIIADAQMFTFIENNTDKALELDKQVIEKLVLNSVQIKADIVNSDEKEKGERRKLNLGHTYGHAVEKVLKLPHGNAVSIGLAVAAKLSVNKGMLLPQNYTRIISLLDKLGLPVTVNTKKDEIIAALAMDKKREGNIIHFVLINNIGQVSIEPIDIDVLKKTEF